MNSARRQQFSAFTKNKSISPANWKSNRPGHDSTLKPRSASQGSPSLFVGSDGDHAGGSLSYNKATGEFDEKQFKIFTSFSNDHEAMTVDDIGRAIADANKRHDGSPTNAVQSAGEFGLLCTLLGDDNGTMKIADMEQLFRVNVFPVDARENLGARTARQWFDATLSITTAISAQAVRIGYRPNEMKLELLTGELKTFFSPLLTRIL